MEFSWPIFFIVLLLGILQLAMGVVFGRCLPICKPKSSGPNPQDARRLRHFADRLRKLVNSVTEDVGRHRSQIRRASDELSLAETTDGVDLTEFVLKSVAQIMQINERLQSRLSTTEDKLQQQTVQIESHIAEARTDPLTGLANRRAFDDELTRRIAEWQRKNTKFCLLMIDFDHFKRLNDRHGHPAGDRVLCGVAGVFEKTLREMDLACRIGGEEFAAILPSTTPVDARRAAERIRLAVASEKFDLERARLSVTISIGLTAIVPNDDSASLIQRADEALYTAKDAGRNCTFFHDGSDCQRVDLGDYPTLPAKTGHPGDGDLTDAAGLTAICDDLRNRLVEVTAEAADSRSSIDDRR